MQRIHDTVTARGGTLAEVDAAQHAYLNAHPSYAGVFVSPGARFEAELETLPTFTTTARGELAASFQGEP